MLLDVDVLMPPAISSSVPTVARDSLDTALADRDVVRSELSDSGG
jgi:hypothetical protein